MQSLVPTTVVQNHTMDMDLLYLSMYPGKRFILPFFEASEFKSRYLPDNAPPASGE